MSWPFPRHRECLHVCFPAYPPRRELGKRLIFSREEDMKKLLIMGALAISALALSQQQASAWVNARFGVGLNWHWQSGGNSFGWGLFTGGQPPGPDFGPGFGP